jgi:parvulin-like peptidyl-prolyl isomerase
MRMKKNMAKYTKWAVYFFAVVFIFGSLFFFGSGSPFRGPGSAAAAAPSPVASVNGMPISREEFNAYMRGAWEQRRMFGGLGLTQIPFLKQQAFDSAVDRTLKLEAADRERVRVTSRDITQHLQEQAQYQIISLKNQQGEKAFRRQVKEKYGSEADFVNYIVDNASSEERDAVQQQLRLQKLEETVKDRVKATEKEYRDSTIKARARLIKVNASTPPSPTNKSQPPSTDAAKAKAEEILKEIKAGGDFAAIAQGKSNDEATKPKGGLIVGLLPPKPTPEQESEAQWFKRGDKKFQYGDEFDEVVFKKLKPGEVSDVFKGNAGYYIVKLEDRKEDLPKDYDDVVYQCDEKKHERTWTQPGAAKECPECKSKNIEVIKTTPAPPLPPTAPKNVPKPQDTNEYLCKDKKHAYNWTEKGKETDACPKCGTKKIKATFKHKERYIQEFESSKQNEAWMKYADDLKKNAKIDIYDPELKAYKIQNEFTPGPTERQKRLKEAVSLYKQALKYSRGSDPYIKSSVLHYQLAQAYQQIGDKQQQQKSLEAALDLEDAVDLRMDLGRLYKQQKKNDKAIDQFKKASELATPQQFYIHTQLAEEFKALKRDDLAEKEKKLAVPPAQPSFPAASQMNLQYR